MLMKQLVQLKSLTPNESVLADFIYNNPSVVMNQTPKELADKAFVSVATVYRLLAKLELTGFNELKIELVKSLKVEQPEVIVNPNYPIAEAMSSSDIIDRMNQLYQNTLDDTMQLCDSQALQSCGDLLVAAKQIDVYTSSANVFFAQNFKFQLQEIGQLINVPEEDYIQRLSAANSTNEHVAILVSFGGRGETTREVAKILKENETPIILITSTQGNVLTEVSDQQLYLASVENHYNKISSFSTRLSLLTIFDLLYTEVFNRSYQQNIDYKLNNYQKLNKELK